MNIDLKEMEQQLEDEIKLNLKNCMIRPSVALIKVGENSEIDFFSSQLEGKCNKIGIYFRLFEFEEDTSELAIINKIKELNNDEYVNGIMVGLPLPEKYNEKRILNSISNAKDIDGLTDINLGRLINGRKSLIPSVTQVIFKIIEQENIDLDNKNIVIIGGLKHINRSLMGMFLNSNANVTVCRETNPNLSSLLEQADIVISGVSLTNLKKINLKDNVMLFDLGVWNDTNYQNSFTNDILKKYKYADISNGIDMVTVMNLLNNVMLCYKNTK